MKTMLICRIGDIVLRVNGKPMFNMSHGQAVRELKNAGQRIEVVSCLNHALFELL